MSSFAHKTAAVCALAVVAAAVGVVAAQNAETAPPPKSTVTRHVDFQVVKPGQVITQIVVCPSSKEAISGGFQLQRGNFAYFLTAATNEDNSAYVVTTLVPNKLAERGVVPALVRVKALCATRGVPVVP